MDASPVGEDLHQPECSADSAGFGVMVLHTDWLCGMLHQQTVRHGVKRDWEGGCVPLSLPAALSEHGMLRHRHRSSCWQESELQCSESRQVLLLVQSFCPHKATAVQHAPPRQHAGTLHHARYPQNLHQPSLVTPWLHSWPHSLLPHTAAAAPLSCPAATTAGSCHTTGAPAAVLLQAYGKTTYLITTLQLVPRGTEGAVSLEGTMAGLGAAALYAAVALALGQVRA